MFFKVALIKRKFVKEWQSYYNLDIDYFENYLNDKGVPVEKRVRKIMGLKPASGGHDRHAAEAGLILYLGG